MPSKGTLKRISRIRRRAIPEVREAFEAGQISARRCDILLYLAPDEQVRQLDRILSERESVKSRSQIAAEVIKAHVEAGRRDLAALSEDLRRALALPGRG